MIKPKSPNDLYWKETLTVGNKGEEFIKNFCLQNGIQYKKSSDYENLIEGWDAKIAGVWTDVKTTPKIFLGKYTISQNKFFVRHPFKENTIARNYCILTMNDPILKYKIKYLGPIEDYLKDFYFKDLTSAIKRLQHYEKKSYKDILCKSPDQMLLNLKRELSHFLKPKIYCNYRSSTEAENYNLDEMSIHLITYEDHKLSFT